MWKKKFTLEQINERSKNTLMETLEIKFTEVGDDFIKATMPVNSKTHQPYGLLHGGASVVLAESLGSFASVLSLAPDDDRWAVGIEINANHLRSVTEGLVTGTVRSIHLGRSLHVWDIRITDPQGKPVCVSRLTVSIVPKRN